MSDYQNDVPEPLEKIPLTKVDWKEVTKTGNIIASSLAKLIKNAHNETDFQTEFLTSMNELFNKVFDVLNSKVPNLAEFLELKNHERFNQPDWSRAFLSNDELR